MVPAIGSADPHENHPSGSSRPGSLLTEGICKHATMKRNLQALAERQYDLVIIGGGIFGICAAWDAALRGLSVALIERGDFSHATSASCFKMVHGGIRYLQHFDLPRIRESSEE